MVVDSSVWIEIFTGGRLQAACERELGRRELRVPALVLFEVYRKVKRATSEEVALEVIAHLGRHEVLAMDRDVALLAADLSLELGLATADAVVLAHARLRGEVLLTLDNDFAGIAGAQVIRR